MAHVYLEGPPMHANFAAGSPRPRRSVHEEAKAEGFRAEEEVEEEDETAVTLPLRPLSARGPGEASGLPPKTERIWEARTRSKLRAARVLRRKTEDEFRRSAMEAALREGHEAEIGAGVQWQLQRKITRSEDLAKSLTSQLATVELKLRELKLSLFEVSRAQANTWPALELVERRLDLREHRPIQERVVDHFQKALEHERQVLHIAQKRFVERIDVCRGVFSDLEREKERLNEDRVKKRQAQRLDKKVLRGRPGTAKDVEHRAQEHLARRSLPRMSEMIRGEAIVPEPVVPGRSHTQTLAWQKGVQELVEKAAETVIAAGRLCCENRDLISEMANALSKVHRATEDSMTRRIDETTALRRALEMEVREVEISIQEADVAIAETKRKCELEKVPLKMLEHLCTTRELRPKGEQFRDTVDVGREELVVVLNGTVKKLVEQLKQQESALAEMKASKVALQWELGHKVEAASIDIACSRLVQRPQSCAHGASPGQHNGRKVAMPLIDCWWGEVGHGADHR